MATMERPKPKAPKVINKFNVNKVKEQVFGFGVEKEDDSLVREQP